MNLTALVIVRDQNGNGISGATVASSQGSFLTNTSGIATLSIASTLVNQTLALTISASGFQTATQSLSVTQYTGTANVQLTPAVQTIPTTFTLTNGTAAVAGAAVFINGTQVGTTSSNGSITVPLQSGSNTLQINAQGYQAFESTIVSGQVPDHMVLTPQAAAASQLSLVISPPGTTLQLGTESGSIGSDGTALTQNSYPPGTYPVTWTSTDGVTTRTDSLVVTAGQTVYQFEPLPVVDAGASGASSSISIAGVSPAAPNPSNPGTIVPVTNAPTSQGLQGIASNSVTVPSGSTSTPNYEFIYPNSNFGKYFTPTQARMYIGKMFVDELSGFQFVLQENQVPVFGYCSEFMDAIGRGKGLVQGQFMVNFISEGYLYTLLNEFSSAQANQQSTDEQAFLNLATQAQTLASQPATNTQAQQQLAQIKQQMQPLLANNPNLASVYSRSKQANTAASTTQKSYNPVYMRTPFTIEFQMEGGGRTVTRRIEQCVLTSNEQIFGGPDETLMESYGFMARRVR